MFVQKLDAVLTKIEKSAVDKRQDGAQGSVAGGGKSDVKGAGEGEGGCTKQAGNV